MIRPILLAMAIGLAPAAWAQTTTGDRVPGPTTAQAPREGANSFTQEQARRRMEESGLREVRDLVLGDDGVWRGSATTAQGQRMRVNMDYQGNVTVGAQQ